MALIVSELYPDVWRDLPETSDVDLIFGDHIFFFDLCAFEMDGAAVYPCDA